jgi:Protein of unknown function (DUF1194)
MRWKTLVLTVGLAAWGALPRPAAAVDLALVLLNDVSKSMDMTEYALVKDGYRAAFSDPEVVAALLSNGGGIAVAYVEFSGKDEIKRVLDWQVLTDAASARAFGEAVAAAPRSSAGNTALSAGLAAAARMLTEGDFAGVRRVIDIASDHPSDGGRSATVRNAAVDAGITINALPIIDEQPIGTIDGRMTYAAARWGSETVAEFYLRNVVGGPGSFVVEARDYAVFGEALKRKLLLEFIAAPQDPARSAVFSVAAN